MSDQKVIIRNIDTSLIHNETDLLMLKEADVKIKGFDKKISKMQEEISKIQQKENQKILGSMNDDDNSNDTYIMSGPKKKPQSGSKGTADYLNTLHKHIETIQKEKKLYVTNVTNLQKKYSMKIDKSMESVVDSSTDNNETIKKLRLLLVNTPKKDKYTGTNTILEGDDEVAATNAKLDKLFPVDADLEELLGEDETFDDDEEALNHEVSKISQNGSDLISEPVSLSKNKNYLSTKKGSEIVTSNGSTIGKKLTDFIPNANNMDGVTDAANNDRYNNQDLYGDSSVKLNADGYDNGLRLSNVVTKVKLDTSKPSLMRNIAYLNKEKNTISFHHVKASDIIGTAEVNDLNINYLDIEDINNPNQTYLVMVSSKFPSIKYGSDQSHDQRGLQLYDGNEISYELIRSHGFVKTSTQDYHKCIIIPFHFMDRETGNVSQDIITIEFPIILTDIRKPTNLRLENDKRTLKMDGIF